jgi:hypothetical protein
MPKFARIPRWSIAALLLSPAQLLAGCGEPEEIDPVVDDVSTRDDTFRAWTGYTSEEYPPLICRNGQAVRGIDCMGDSCDDIALDCRTTVKIPGEHMWLPYFSEEGAGSADEGHCVGNNVWMTGITCSGRYCDNISLRCSTLIGSSTGDCEWSGWYSDEQGPYTAPSAHYIKAIECEGMYCDNKRYRHCRMN